MKKKNLKHAAKKVVATALAVSLGIGSLSASGSLAVSKAAESEETDETVTNTLVDSGLDYDYARALQYSMYFYDANMCGTDVAENTLLSWRGDCHTYDAQVPLQPMDEKSNGTNLSQEFIDKYKDILDPDGDGYVDVSGGFHDAGDHVKFGMPENYTAATLGWGYYEFRDSYTKLEQTSHIETLLRYVNDYLMRCTFLDETGKVIAHCYQVGDGDIDHAYWQSPEVDSMARPAFFLTADKPQTDYVVSAAASLTINYLNFKDTDPEYAEKSLKYAKALWEFANENELQLSDNGDGPKAYYYSNKWEDDYCWAGAWLYIATKNETYLDQILPYVDYYAPSGWAYCWNDMWSGALTLLGIIDMQNPELDLQNMYREVQGKTQYESADFWEQIIKAMDTWMNNYTTPAGYAYISQWGSARYNTAMQFVTLVYEKYHKGDEPSSYAKWAESQMKYLMGNNPLNRSYIVGYNENSAKYPHHRAASGLLTAEDTREQRHVLYGALVGGPDGKDNHIDVTSDYIYNEVTSDYNAAFVGACAALYEYFGTADMAITENFPPVDANGGEESGGNGYWVEAFAVNDLHTDGAGVTKISLKVMTDAIDAKKDISVRYFFNSEEISNISSVEVKELYDQASAEEENADGVISGPFKYEGMDNTYYYEITWDGYPIANSGKKYQCLAGMYWGDFWDPTNDYSYQGLPVLEDTEMFGNGNEVKTDYICVYSGGVLVGGIEPDGTTPSGATTESSTTEKATTETLTTEKVTTEKITTEVPTTEKITTQEGTTEVSTTERVTTQANTTEVSTTEKVTTEKATTEVSTTEKVTTERNTTEVSTTEKVTTERNTTEISTTEKVTTEKTTTETLTTEKEPFLTTENSTENPDTTETPAKIAVTGVTIDKQTADLVVGDLVVLKAEVAPENATDKTISWESSNPAVAVVDKDGAVTAKEKGMTIISVKTTDGAYQANCLVSVTEKTIEKTAVTGVILNTENQTITVGQEITLLPTVIPTDADDKSVIWKVADSSIATVENGTVRGISEGETEVTVVTMDGGFMDTCKITVKEEKQQEVLPESVILNQPELTLKVGAAEKLTATVLPETATNKNIILTSMQQEIATIDENGVITALAEGTAVIIATSESGAVTAYCIVTVTKESEEIQPESVSISQASLDLLVGNSETLTAEVMPATASQNVTWKSSNEEVVRVDANGKVTAISKGMAIIKVTTADGSKSAECQVTVSSASTEEKVNVNGVELNLNTLSLQKENTAVLIATVSPENAADKTVVWSTSNASVATVENGKVTAVGAGTATITVTTMDGGLKATCIVEVKEEQISTVPVTDIVLKNNDITLKPGESDKLDFQIQPSDATNQEVIFKSNDPEVVTVSENGEIKALKEGTTIITITTVDGGKLAYCIVNVKDETDTTITVSVDSVTITTTEKELVIGETEKLVAEISPINATNQNISWRSDNEEVLTVDQSGNITAIKAGQATVIVQTEDGGKLAFCSVTVKAKQQPVTEVKVTAIHVDANTITLNLKKTKALQVTVAPSNATNKAVTYATSDKTVATVNASGKITAVGAGVATITVKAASGISTAVTVKVKPAKVTSLKKKVLGKSKVKLTWKKQKNVSGYKVYRYNTKTKKYKLYKTTKNNFVTITKLSSNTTYKFKVRAYKKSKYGNLYGKYSKILKVKTK